MFLRKICVPRVVRLGLVPAEAAKTALKGTIITFITLCGVDVLAYLMNDEQTLFDLFANLTMNFIQLGRAGIISSGITGIGMTALAGASSGLVVVGGFLVVVAAVSIVYDVDRALRDLDDKMAVDINRFFKSLEKRTHQRNNRLINEVSWLVNCGYQPLSCGFLRPPGF